MKLFAVFFLFGALFALYLGPISTFWGTSIVFSGVAIRHLLLTNRYCRLLDSSKVSQVLMISGMVLGAFWSGSELHRQLDQRLPADFDGTEVIASGIVSGQSRVESNRTVFDFRPEVLWLPESLDGSESRAFAVQSDALDELSGRTFRVSWYGAAPTIESGQRWMLRIRLKRAHSLSNPGGFDYPKQLLIARVHALASVRKSPSNELLSSQSRVFIDYRGQLDIALLKNAATFSRMALMRGLLVGLRDDIDDETWRLLRATGTSHLLAISGLHIGIVAAWGFLICGGVWRILVRVFPGSMVWSRVNRIDAGAILSIATATAYAALAGFTLPTQRALIMLAVFLILQRLRIKSNPLDSLAIAAVAVVLVDPLSPLSVGFWLSFFAVLAILLLGRRFNHRQSGPTERSLSSLASVALRRCKLALYTHFMLALALIPVTVVFFSEVSIVSPVANLLAIPVVGLITVPVLLLWALCQPFIEVQWLLLIANSSLNAVMWLLVTLDSHIPSSIHTPLLRWWHILPLLMAIALLSLPRQAVPGKFVLPLLLPALLATFSPRTVAGLRVTVLDVGQGLSVVVRTPSKSMVYDTGGRLSEQRTMAKQVLTPYLRSQGVRKLELLMLSHADTDHAAGATDLLETFPAGSVLGSYPDHPVKTVCQAGMNWSWDQVEFTVLHPAATDVGNRNDRSCSVLVRLGEATVLLPGDIEQAGEAALVERLLTDPSLVGTWSSNDKLSLLIAPHHGSATSSTPRFLDVFRPKVVVYAIGHKNRFGFPHESVQMRYKLNCVRQLRTDAGGAITIDFDTSGRLISLKQHRCVVKRPWLSRCGDVELTQGLDSSHCLSNP